MSHLALAQASVIAELVRSPPQDEHAYANLAVTGLHSPSALRRVLDAGAGSSGAAAAASSAAAAATASSASAASSGPGAVRDHSSDFSALLMEDWIDEYMRERHSFDSVSLFCEIKLKELIEVRQNSSLPFGVRRVAVTRSDLCSNVGSRTLIALF